MILKEFLMAAYQNPALRYREVAVRTANPLQLILMLYDEAVCSLQEAQSHVQHKNIAARSRSVNKCISIISELQSCLNLKAGGEIAVSLDRLYDYMKRRIFAANVQQSSQPLAEVEALLENIRSAWREIAGQSEKNNVTHEPHKMPEPIITGTPSPAPMQLNALNVSI